MTRIVAAYVAALFAMLALDALWLGVVAKPLYRQGIGHLMAEQPRFGAAALFYLMYPLGLLVFAVLPHAADGWARTMLAAALLGAFAYATYDLSNLATLKGWPIGLSLLDITWGCFASTAAAAAGKAALDRVA